MRTLITGGHGFLGGRLGVYFSNNGHDVILGSRKNRENPSWLPNAKNVTMDWNSIENLSRNLEGIELVIHTSGMNSIDCELNPSQALKINGVGTDNLAKAAARNGVKNFIYISTAHVYSNPLEGKINEMSITKNSHPYATSHLAGESAIIEIAKKSAMNTLILRLANAFGYPVQAGVNCWNLLVNEICREIIVNQRITIKTNGQQKRNFINIHDLNKIIFSLVNKMSDNDLPRIINVGVEKSISVYEMAKFIQSRSTRVLGFDPIIKIHENIPRKPTNDLIFESLNFDLYKNYLDENNSQIEIDTLLTRCKEWFQTSDD